MHDTENRRLLPRAARHYQFESNDSPELGMYTFDWSVNDFIIRGVKRGHMQV